MPFFKLTFFWNGRQSGWTETWYTEGPSEDPNSVVIPPGVIVRMTDLRSEQYTLLGYRISNVAKRRSSIPITLNVNGTAGTGLRADVAGVAALIRCTAIGGYRRNVWLRGLPDDWVRKGPSGEDFPAAPLLAAIDALRLAIVNTGTNTPQKVFNLQRQLTQEEAPPIRIVSIRRYAAAAGFSVITTISPHSYPLPMRVLIGGVSRCEIPALRGTWNAFPGGDQPAGHTFIIDMPWPFGDNSAEIELSRGYVRPYNTMYPVLTDLAFVRFGTRDTGRPFGLSRGRQSSKRCRR